MLFYIDESWQKTSDNKMAIGVLAAIQIKAHDFNKISTDIHRLEVTHLGYQAGNIELKGKAIFSDYIFGLEEKGIKSNNLELARELLKYLDSLGSKCFASIVESENEMPLECANADNLDRPFFFLFERINLFMEENYPGLMAHLIFDDRGVQANNSISRAVSNFLHKSQVGKSFDKMIKVPSFAISTNNIGLQLADIVAYTIGKHHVHPGRINEFHRAIKSLEYLSRKKIPVGDKEYPLYGFKVVRDKKNEAGDLFDPGRA